MKANAMRRGITMSSALSVPVRKAIKAAPGNNISHPMRQSPNDQGHSLLRAWWTFAGSLFHVFNGEFLLNAIRTARVPRMGGPKPPPNRSIRSRRANRIRMALPSRPGFTKTMRKAPEKKIARSPVSR